MGEDGENGIAELVRGMGVLEDYAVVSGEKLSGVGVVKWVKGMIEWHGLMDYVSPEEIDEIVTNRMIADSMHVEVEGVEE